MRSPAGTVHDVEDFARALEAMAVGARGRSGYAAATAALEWAASLSTSGAARVRRLYAAAADAAIAGERARAQALLADADRLADGGPTTVPASETALAAALAGRPAAVPAPGTAAAALAGHPAAVPEPGAALVGRPALAPVSGAADRADLAFGLALLQAGDVPEGTALIRAGLSAAPGAGLRVRIAAGLGSTLVGEHRAALHILSSAVEEARRTGAIRLLPAALCARAYAAAAVEPTGAALSVAREAAAVAELTGDAFWRRRVTALAAVLHAVRGDAERCLSAIGQASAPERRLSAIGQAPDDALARAWARDASNLLALGLSHGGEPDAADVSSDAVEVLVRAGRRPTADLVDAVERISRQVDAPLRAAGAWRTRGLLAAPSEFASCFATALDLHRAVEQPFETARTLLAYGERLRRAGRRVDARRRLREALDVFEWLGARPWAGRAAAELAATGDSPGPDARRSRAAAGTTPALTAQELQVARAVATGQTNREVAQALFLSHKTIEFHLGNIFRKLGLRRRAQLVQHFLQE
jgi:DNA-binding CsgD family transcriptional regulator